MKLIAQLGVIGFKTERFYADIHKGWRKFPSLQMFVNDGVVRRWYRLLPWPFELLKVEVLNADNAARIARRTMRPYAVVRRADGEPVECMSFPWAENGRVEVMVRKPDQPDTLVQMGADRLRPWHFYPRKTGVPACDPVQQ
jgi:hypothetical protein